MVEGLVCQRGLLGVHQREVRRRGGGGRVKGQAALGVLGLKRKRGLAAAAFGRVLAFAMLLAADKRVLLLDEPMAGVSMEDVPELVEDEGETGRSEAVARVDRAIDAPRRWVRIDHDRPRASASPCGWATKPCSSPPKRTACT